MLRHCWQNPPADGIFVYHVSNRETTSLQVGDVILSVGGTNNLNNKSFYEAMQPKSKEDKSRTMEVLRNSRKVSVEVKADLKAFKHCTVRKAECGWELLDDHAEEPDFSAFADGTDHWMQNSLGDDLAGYEHLHVSHKVGCLALEVNFRLGADGDEGKRWEYVTLARTLHLRERGLPAIQSAFFEKRDGKMVRTGDVAQQDGLWRGVRLIDDKEVAVKSPALTPTITSYTTTFVPLTMPLRKGAASTFYSMHDGTGEVHSRSRMYCEGRKKVKVAGKEVNAWCFAWKHYGYRPPEEEEKFFISDDRKLVRLEWGPNYANCWSEWLPKEQALKGLPEIVLKGMEQG
jgi:hypothetical protein